MLHNEVQKLIPKAVYTAEEELVLACKFYQQWLSRALSLEVPLEQPASLDIFKKRMKRYASLLPNEANLVRELTTARVEAISGVRQLAARGGIPTVQHDTTKIIESTFYYSYVELIHSYWGVISYMGAMLYGVPYYIKEGGQISRRWTQLHFAYSKGLGLVS